LAVNTADVATPLVFVTAVVTPPAKLPLAPVPGAANVTVIPLNGLPPESFTVATNGAANAVLIGALCGVPLVAVIVAGVPTVFVRLKFTVLRPVAAAVTVYGPPAIAFAVNEADDTPEAFVATTIVAVPLLNTPVAPVPGAVNVTFTPDTGLPPASFTVTARGFAKAVLIFADCGVVPAFAVIVAAAPVTLVSEKLAGVATPDTVAATTYPPNVPLAVNTVDVATPLPFVTAVLVVAKLPLAPVAGGVNVTVIPLSGFPPASFTVATNGDAKAVSTAALWPEPLVTVTEAGVPAVFVRLKLAGVPTPDTDAVTV
jgi:hypothetical protein